jgi:23S rRNA pseudouridine2605 synthase
MKKKRPSAEGGARRPGSGPRSGSGSGSGTRSGSDDGGRGGAAGGGPELRLHVFLARAGVASRRAAEEMIGEGRVKVNGRTVTEPGTKVRPAGDQVKVDGKLVERVRTQWIALHKPAGYVTTRDDPEGRRTVYDLLPEELHGLFHVGRLDRASMGLLLLTNDGETANRLLHPRYEVTKEYLADVEGEPDRAALERLQAGVESEGETLRAEEVRLVDGDGERSRLQLVLTEGKRREVRRMLEAIGHPVTRLVRRRFGPIRLERLPRGKWRKLTDDEVRSLRDPLRREAPPAARGAPRGKAPPKGTARGKTSTGRGGTGGKGGGRGGGGEGGRPGAKGTPSGGKAGGETKAGGSRPRTQRKPKKR